MLLTEDGLAKLADYGLPNIANSNENRITMLHYAPEMFQERKELKSDVWSLGILLFELDEGKNPFEDVELDRIHAYIYNSDPPSLSWKKWLPDFVDFVSKCLVKDVNERPSVHELMDVSV